MSTDIGRIADARQISDYHSVLDVYVQSGMIKLHMREGQTSVIVCLDSQRLADLMDFLESAAAHARIPYAQRGYASDGHIVTNPLAQTPEESSW